VHVSSREGTRRQQPSYSSQLDCTLQDFLDYVVGDKTAAERFNRYCYGSGFGVGTQGRSAGRKAAPAAAVMTADGLRLALTGVQQQQQRRMWEEE
jgi:hypothetical protein